MRDASSIGRPFGHDESFNMGVYPGRGPALISRADMIILPSPITIDSFAFADNTFAVVVDVAPSTTALKNPLTPSVVVSDLVVAGETSSDTFLIAHEGLPAPGFSTSTAAGSGFSNKSPTPCSLKLSSLAPEGRC